MPNYCEPAPLGYTSESKQYVKRYLKRIGRIQSVLCESTKIVGVGEYTTTITGENGTMKLSGFNCGYRGEGPHGLLWLMNEVLGEKRITIQDIAAGETFRWINTGNPDVLQGDDREDSPAREQEGVA